MQSRNKNSKQPPNTPLKQTGLLSKESLNIRIHRDIAKTLCWMELDF